MRAAMPFPATTPRFPFVVGKPRPSPRPTSYAPIVASAVAILLMLLVLRARTSFEIPKLTKPLLKALDTVDSRYYTRAAKRVPSCARGAGRARSFLIVFQSRSGSTAISTHLKLHSEVHMTTLEYLDRRGVKMTNVTGALAETRRFFESGIARGLVPGFKIRSYHVLPAAQQWRKLAEEYGTRIIWQYRKNVVKSAIGTYQKEVLGDATAISGIRKDELADDRCSMGVGCKFRIDDIPAFHALLKNRVAYQNQITEAVRVLDGGRACTLEVPYEDYLYYPRETVYDMQRFLGLGRENTEADRVKATADSLCDVIENFDELCDSFYGCASWQPYFDDFVNQCRCTNFSSGSVEFCDVN